MGKKKINIGSLRRGEYAITADLGMGILMLDDNSFDPASDSVCLAVNLANGIGSFAFTDKCYRATREEAFEAASQW